MRVQFKLPLGSQGWDKHLEMPAVPREGDTVDFSIDDDSDRSYVVRHVVWYPNMPEIDAYVVLEP